MVLLCEASGSGGYPETYVSTIDQLIGLSSFRKPWPTLGLKDISKGIEISESNHESRKRS